MEDIDDETDVFNIRSDIIFGYISEGELLRSSPFYVWICASLSDACKAFSNRECIIMCAKYSIDCFSFKRM